MYASVATRPARRSRSEDRVERRGLQELKRFGTPKPESADAAFLIFFRFSAKIRPADDP
jgi:hypothetical protein